MSSEISIKGVLEIEMIMECLTGLRIGGGPEAMEIGGVENIVIKDPLTRLPYVPGSSLKGAMRAHYELFSTRSIDYEVVKAPQKVRIHMCYDPDCEICRVFGRVPKKPRSEEGEGKEERGQTPDNLDNVLLTTRLKVDDAYPTDETVNSKWKELPEGVEVKYENVLDRLTSQATPRGVERIPRGSEFRIVMSYKIFDEKDVENISVVFQSLKLVEDDYLGAYGSRGYGRVRFKNISMRLKKREYYESCDDKSKVTVKGKQYNSLEELLKEMGKIKEEIRQQLGFMQKAEK